MAQLQLKKIHASGTPGQAPSSGKELADNFNSNFDAVKADSDEKDKKIVQLEQEKLDVQNATSESLKFFKSGGNLSGATFSTTMTKLIGRTYEFLFTHKQDGWTGTCFTGDYCRGINILNSVLGVSVSSGYMSGPELTIGKTYHVFVDAYLDKAVWFINGVETTTNTASGVSVVDYDIPIKVGILKSAQSNTDIANIDEYAKIAVYNRYLTKEEKIAIYNNSQVVFYCDAVKNALTSLITYDSVKGNTLVDLVNKNKATIQGAGISMTDNQALDLTATKSEILDFPPFSPLQKVIKDGNEYSYSTSRNKWVKDSDKFVDDTPLELLKTQHVAFDNAETFIEESFYNKPLLTGDFYLEFYGIVNTELKTAGNFFGFGYYGTPNYGGFGLTGGEFGDVKISGAFAKGGSPEILAEIKIPELKKVCHVIAQKTNTGISVFVDKVKAYEKSIDLKGYNPVSGNFTINKRRIGVGLLFKTKFSIGRIGLGVLSQEDIDNRFNNGYPEKYVLSENERQGLIIEVLPERSNGNTIINTVDNRAFVTKNNAEISRTFPLNPKDVQDMVSKEELDVQLSGVASKQDLNDYATIELLNSFDYKKVDFTGYDKTVELDKRYILASSVNDYATKEDLLGFIPKTSEIKFATKVELQDKASQNQISLLQEKSGMGDYALKSYVNTTIKSEVFGSNNIENDAISENKLSPEVIQMIQSSGGGTIVNNPDGEDLTSIDNKLVFAEKEAGIQKGVWYAKRHELQAIFSAKNRTLVFNKIIDLGGQTFTVEGDCCWVFDGGLLRNGILKFRNAVEITASGQIFEGIALTEDSYPFSRNVDVHWFGAKGDLLTDDTLAFRYAISFIRWIAPEMSPWIRGASPGTVVPNPDFDETLNYPTPPDPHNNTRTRQTLLAKSPKGFCISDTIEITKTNNCNIDFDRIMCTSSNITAIKLDDLHHCEIKISQLRKKSDRADVYYYVTDWSNRESQGILTRNCWSCKFTIDLILGFTRGFIALADGTGWYCNKLWLGSMDILHEGFVVKTLNGGWPNQNYVYGGRYGAPGGSYRTEGVATRRSHIKFESDGTYGANSWIFRDMSIEGQIVINGQSTLLLNTIEGKCDLVEIHGLRNENTAANGSPVVVISKETNNVSLTTDQYNDNVLALFTDGTECPEWNFRTNRSSALDAERKFSYRSKVLEVAKEHIFNDSFNQRLRVNGQYVHKGDTVVFGDYGKFNHYTNSNYWQPQGCLGYLVDLKNPCDFIVEGSARLLIFPLDDNLMPFTVEPDNKNEVLRFFSYWAYLGSDYSAAGWYSQSDSKNEIAQIKSDGNVKNFRYLFVCCTGDYPMNNLVFKRDKYAPLIPFTYPPKFMNKNHLQDCYFIDKDLKDLNITVEVGMKFYDTLNEKVYTVTKKGSFGSTGTCIFTEMAGSSTLTPKNGSVNSLYVGQYCILGQNYFKITEVDKTNNLIKIDTPLNIIAENKQLTFDKPTYRE